MEGGDAEDLDLLSNILGSQHGVVVRGLVAIGLDLHATGDSAKSFTSGQIGDVDKGVIEGSVDVGHAEHLLTFANLGSEGDLNLFKLVLLSFSIFICGSRS